MKPERQAWADGVKLGEVGFKVAFDYYDVGSEEFMLSFFSTVAYRLEKGNWGKRFPKIMKELYKGKLRFWHLMEAVREMQIIEQEMKELPANLAIWDNDDPKKRPEYSEYDTPEGNPEAANLAEYFICTHGDRIFEVFYGAVVDARELLRPVRLINIWLE